MGDTNSPKMTLKHLRNIVLVVLISVFTFVAGYDVGVRGYQANVESEKYKISFDRKNPADKNVDFALFWQVWDTLEAKYYDKSKLDPTKMVYGAIKGMVGSVDDPYTVFLSPEENKIVQEDLSGHFEGVGIQIGFKGNQLAVIAPLPDSPALKAGVRAGDLVLGIKDEKKDLDRGTVGITLPEAVQAIRGRAGTKVTLLLLREGVDEPFSVDITRENINVPSVKVEYVGEDGRIAHISVIKFSGETVEEWNAAVAEVLVRRNLAGIIVDVRNNPGGYLQAAVDLSGDFMDTDSVVVVEEIGGRERVEYRSDRLPRLKNIKTVVLINEGSASASEILAGALRDNRRIQLVGDTTFGKGTIQEPVQVNKLSGFHVTIARWLTPSGIWVNDGGIKPDISVENKDDTEADEQLEEAIRLLNRL
jgi:carboxyl-terminal processing protease